MEKLPNRNEIDSKYKWKLEDMYESNDAWEKAYTHAESLIECVASYSGQISKSAAGLLAAIKALNDASIVVEKLYVYSRMRRDEDNSSGIYQGLSSRAEQIYTKLGAASSYLEPELLTISDDMLRKFYEDEPELKNYSFNLDEILRLRAHVLSAAEERIVAMSRDAAGGAADVFTMFNNADIRFPVITDAQGNKVELTKGRYSLYLENKNRNVRKRAYKALYKTYASFKNTLSASYAASVKSDRFYSEVRGYASTLEAALDADNVPQSVYDELIETMHQASSAMNRYIRLRKQVLNLRKIYMYDLYVPIVDMPEKKYSFEEAKDIVIKALAPLGEDYITHLKEAFTDGWIDVFESVGKTSGAYSWGTYDCPHPYVLLNWQGKLDDVFTLAHELGHAMHSYYSKKNQPYNYASYKIFVAEVASTVNENLLINYLLDNTDDTNEKAFILNHYLEEFRTTVYRQTMFAEFEKKAHGKIGAGGSLTCEDLDETYRALNELYYGRTAVVDDEISHEWMRIPHFYTSFYVYKYATGFSSAALLAKGILSGDKDKLDKYHTFLKSGGSDYPMEILKRAGVDLSTPAPVQAAVDMFVETLYKLEGILCG